jgi:hydroxymethylbilane synthase
MKRLRLGTANAAPALWRASWVARALAGLPRGPEIELAILESQERVAEALRRGDVDLAVGAMDETPLRLSDGLVLAAVPSRGVAEDVLVAAAEVTLATLPRGATVAAAGAGRRALLRERRPDLVVVPAGEGLPAVVDRAGLVRLGLETGVREVLDPANWPPAPGQGALAVLCRAKDGDLRALLSILDDAPTRAATAAERAFAARLGPGRAAVGAHGRVVGGGATLDLSGFVAATEGPEILRGARIGPAADAEAVAIEFAEELIGRASPNLRRELSG